MNFGEYESKNITDLLAVDVPNYEPIKFDIYNGKKESISQFSIKSAEIETLNLEDESIEMNTINYKIDNIKLSLGNAECTKSSNSASILSNLNSFEMTNAILDKIKGKGIYSGSVRALNVESAILNIID